MKPVINLWKVPVAIWSHFVLCFVYTGMQPYSCTGYFQTDFVELCRRLLPPDDYTPAVVLRPRRPRSPVPMQIIEEKTTKTAKSSKKEEPEKSETTRTLESEGRLLLCSLQWSIELFSVKFCVKIFSFKAGSHFLLCLRVWCWGVLCVICISYKYMEVFSFRCKKVPQGRPEIM